MSIIDKIVKRVKEEVVEEGLESMKKLVLTLDKEKKYIVIVPEDITPEDLSVLNRWINDEGIETKIVFINAKGVRVIEFF